MGVWQGEVGVGMKKSDFGDQSEAASHKAGDSPEGEKSGDTEVSVKKLA